jgi:predicted nucleic acid-binding protein
MIKICPFIKDICKGDTCLAWQDKGCSIFTFLDHFKGSNLIFEKQQGLRERILEDEVKIPQLVSECLEWSKRKKITRPTKEEINAFLIVKNITLYETSMRSLWRQVKAKLRESKREMAQIASQSWRENISNIGLAWTSNEDEALIREFDSGKSSSDLAQIHKRTLRAIELRLEKHGKIQLPK